MPKWFNNAGPCQTDIHYMLSPLARMPELTQLIGQRGYFIIHAPRQMGKTTAMLTLAQQLTSTGWLVIFDRRPELPPIAERTTTEMAMTPGDRSVVVIRG